jgi:ketosteroid isomerase-like protein
MKLVSAQAAEAAFYTAFQRADVDAMMEVWAEDDAVFCVHPGGGRLSGVAAVRVAWRSIFSGGPRLHFELDELQRLTLPTVAVHTLYERISVRGEGGPPHLVMATNIYLLTVSGWRMLGHHASPLPRSLPGAETRSSNLH